MSGLGIPWGAHPTQDATPPIAGRDYILKLRKYLGTNLSRLAPAPPRGKPRDASWLQQSYTIMTLGLDPNSAPLSDSVKMPLTLGFGRPSAPPSNRPSKPLLLRLPPDKLLYLLLRWQALPQGLPHVGSTDVPVPDGVSVGARGARPDGGERVEDGDVDSVRSWVGTIRSVSMGSSLGSRGISGWFSQPKEVDEDKVLLELYTIFNTLPGLVIHPPFSTDQRISELLEAGGYGPLGGVDIRVPLDVLRNLQILELESYDPRGLLIPKNPLLHSLTVRDVEDADDWLPELLIDGDPNAETPPPRFPNLHHLSLNNTSLLSLPTLPLTSVTHLDLSHNLLNEIPEALSHLHNLVSLNLSNNLISSVRNAPSTLGNIHTLNLARNKIDCLVGLERVLGLRRVDVRGNLLREGGEVGRLAVLPVIEAVWCSDNPFSSAEWRPEVATNFAAEGRSIVLDDMPLSWSEQRRVQAYLEERGLPRVRSRAGMHIDTVAAGSSYSSLVPPSPVRAGVTRNPSPGTPSTSRRGISPNPRSTLAPTTQATRQGTASVSPPGAEPSGSKATPKSTKTRRRPKRRVVNLGEDTATPPDSALSLSIGTGNGENTLKAPSLTGTSAAGTSPSRSPVGSETPTSGKPKGKKSSKANGAAANHNHTRA